ncbi:hypothetical protein HL42_2078 [Trichophyton rubrum]|nr:hypothetical protein HL42_2078 [Trichophyton rubrum]
MNRERRGDVFFADSRKPRPGKWSVGAGSSSNKAPSKVENEAVISIFYGIGESSGGEEGERRGRKAERKGEGGLGKKRYVGDRIKPRNRGTKSNDNKKETTGRHAPMTWRLQNGIYFIIWISDETGQPTGRHCTLKDSSTRSESLE